MVTMMLMSGCGEVAQSDVSSAIRALDLSLDGIGPFSGDIGFSFTYVNDDDDVDAEVTVQYMVSGNDWADARVLENSGDVDAADLTNLPSGEYTFYWDSDGDNIGTINPAACFFRIVAGDIEDVDPLAVDAFVVNNATP